MVSDTIAAIATPSGRGSVGIVRVSGPGAFSIAGAVIGKLPAPRKAVYRRFLDDQGRDIDRGLVIRFPAPNSFTGEDVLELHGHGGAVVLDLLLCRVISLGARPARPGEFSERAFLNDRIDLAQAEAIADLIDSRSAQAARSAMRSLDGEFSREIRTLVDATIALRVYIEATLDFPDEEIDLLDDPAIRNQLRDLIVRTASVRRAARQGSLLREGLGIVIAGSPNTGKSTLLNRLAGDEAAIVSHLPGTTRDILQRDILLDGIPLRVTDTAGLRRSNDPIEREGVRRAWREIGSADLILLLIDSTKGYGVAEAAIEADLPPGVPRLRVWNKIDIDGAAGPPSREAGIGISALEGTGTGELRRRITALAGVAETGEGVFLARRRHLVALDRAIVALESADAQYRQHRAGELLAEELRIAQRVLGEITGEFTSEDLLGRIFADFCIGK
ncbi:MAG: tRNA uridine-5-carboxymethylaminomethyl(34) synthesis GTPase MnmE [Pseudomonadota bacterium]|nr:tRNA uridine-5-carboxymethylaminomethyl(34) synthesis GTPase MnmE [Pseudomonadota bacterium]